MIGQHGPVPADLVRPAAAAERSGLRQRVFAEELPLRRFLPALLVLLALPIADFVLFQEIRARVGPETTRIWVLGTLILALGLGTLGLQPQWLRRLKLFLNITLWDPGLTSRAAFLTSALLFPFPGPLTDMLAVLLLVPWTRRRLLGWLLARLLGVRSLDSLFHFQNEAYDQTSGNHKAPLEPSRPARQGPGEAGEAPARDAEFEILPEDERK